MMRATLPDGLRGVLRAVSALVFVVALGYSVLHFGGMYLLGTTYCEPPNGRGFPDDSNWGVATWQWDPPGLRCEWTQAMNGFDGQSEPGFAGAVALGGVLASLTMHRLARRKTHPDAVANSTRYETERVS